MVTKSRLSRRSVIAGAAAGAAALGLGGRAGATPRFGRAPMLLRQAANLPTPREQTFVIEEVPINIWDSFNPFIPNGETGQYGLQQVCRECLFYANFLSGEVRPWLGVEYTYNADFTECTLKLNPAAQWSDGRPYTADDIVFSQTLLLENEGLNGASEVKENVKSVTAADPQTVVWALTKPQPRFHYRFVAGISSDSMRVVPRHVWEGQDPGTFRNNPPVFTGPYTLVEASSSKLHYLWQKNPNYWNKAEMDPAPEYFLVRQAAGVDGSVQEFLAGNLDVAHQGAGFDYINQTVVESQYDQTTRFDFADPCPRGFFMNAESPSGLFATPEGRWVMSYIMDRQTIAETIWQPSSRPASYPWADYQAWQEWATPEIVEKYDFSFSIEKANAALDALGATRDGDVRTLNGKPLALTCISPVPTTGLEMQIAQSFAGTAKEVGIDIQVKSLPGSAFGDTYQTGAYDFTSHWLCGMAFDPNQLYGSFHSKNYKPVGERTTSDQAATRFNTKEFDAVIDKLDVADPTDPANRAVFDQGLDLFLQNSPALGVIQTIYPLMYSTAQWTGWPSPENPYTIPAPWWSHFLFVIGSVTPAQPA